MRMLILFLWMTVVLILTVSCSFKPKDDESHERRFSQKIEIAEHDADGDGILDKEDERPFIADIPIIGGEFFKDLSISFIHRNDRKKISLLNNHEGISNFFQLVGEMNSGEGDHIRSRLTSNHLNVFTYSNPHSLANGRTEDVFNIVENVSVEINSELNIRYKEGAFTNTKIDLLFYNSSKRELEQISSLVLTDRFQFNEPNLKRLIFPVSYSRPELVVNDRGRNLFLRIRDFTIVNTGESYQRVHTSVLTKSIPILVHNGTSTDVHYISAKNSRLPLLKLLDESNVSYRELGGNIYEVNTIKNKEVISVDNFGNSVKDEIRWVIVTRNTTLNHQSYTFGVGDFVYLSYMSKMRPRSLRPKINSRVGESSPLLVHSAILKKDAFDRSRILFRPISFKGEYTEVFPTKNCSFDNCFVFKSKFVNGTGLNALGSLYFLEMKLNNEILNLGVLKEEGKVLLKKLDDVDLFEVVMGPEIKAKVKKENSFSLSLTTHRGIFCDGESFCSGVNCQNYFSAIKPICSLSTFQGEYLHYDAKLIRKTSDWTGSLYAGWESYE